MSCCEGCQAGLTVNDRRAQLDSQIVEPSTEGTRADRHPVPDAPPAKGSLYRDT